MKNKETSDATQANALRKEGYYIYYFDPIKPVYKLRKKGSTDSSQTAKSIRANSTKAKVLSCLSGKPIKVRELIDSCALSLDLKPHQIYAALYGLKKDGLVEHEEWGLYRAI